MSNRDGKVVDEYTGSIVVGHAAAVSVRVLEFCKAEYPQVRMVTVALGLLIAASTTVWSGLKRDNRQRFAASMQKMLGIAVQLVEAGAKAVPDPRHSAHDGEEKS